MPIFTQREDVVVRKRFITKYAKFKRGTVRALSEKFDIPYAQFSGRISGSRKVSEKNAKILTEKFGEIGINVPVEYWYGKKRGALRKLIKEWYKENK